MQFQSRIGARAGSTNRLHHDDETVESLDLVLGQHHDLAISLLQRTVNRHESSAALARHDGQSKSPSSQVSRWAEALRRSPRPVVDHTLANRTSSPTWPLRSLVSKKTLVVPILIGTVTIAVVCIVGFCSIASASR